MSPAERPGRPTWRSRGRRPTGWGAVRILVVAALALTLGDAPPVAAQHRDALRHAEATPAPNIVVVMADDMRADELRFLPAVRRLQRSGVTFTQAISADSLCCPARATLLTGKLAHNHLTIGNNVATFGGYPVFAEHNDLHNLLPRWLGKHGYRTAWIGKYLNAIPEARHFSQPDWSYFAVPVRDVYDYRRSAFAINGSFNTDRRYRETYTRRLLLSRVRAWSGRARPFFVLYSSLAPHRSRRAGAGGAAGAPEVEAIHRDFDPTRLEVSPSVGEVDVSDKPAWLQAYVARAGPQPYPTRLETHRVEALLSLNDTVRDLLATLDRLHETRRTIVVFTSDNGYLLREHDVDGKNKGYAESVTVPLVVRGPGFRGGSQAGPTVSLADLTATVRRAAGVRRTHEADGLPLQDVLADPTSFARRPVEIEGSTALYPDGAAFETDGIGRFYTGAVWGPYSYVRYQTGEQEFYDRTTDPWQLDNAFEPHPSPGSAQALLERWYDAHVDCREAACNDVIPGP